MTPPGGAPRAALPLDVHTWVGSYPYRAVPHPEPAVLVRVLAREGIARAWTGHLPSAFHRDPTAGNEELYALLAPHRGVLDPAPVVRPDWPGWERVLAEAVARGAPAVRAYPPQWGMSGDAPAMRRLVEATADAGVALVLTVRFEDLRQRGPLDVAGDLPAAAVRQLARVSRRSRLVVLGAGKEFIEEVQWGLTPAEQTGLWWDISWIWGPPEDHLARLFRTMGAERFVYGTGWPMRLTQTPRANLALLPAPLRGVSLGEPRRRA